MENMETLNILLLRKGEEVILGDYDPSDIIHYDNYDYNHNYRKCWSTSDERFIRNPEYNKYTQYDKYTWLISLLEKEGLKVLNKEEVLEKASKNRTWELSRLPVCL